MSRLDPAIKQSIIDLSEKLSRKEIAEKLNVKKSSVDYVLRPQGEDSAKDEPAEVKEDADFHKAWAEHWKQRYLLAHSQLIENNIEPLPLES